jgi:hypothetical protein
MKKIEKQNNYKLVSGNTIIDEQTSLPKLAKNLGCSLSLFYKFGSALDSTKSFPYKGYEYNIIKITNN